VVLIHIRRLDESFDRQSANKYNELARVGSNSYDVSHGWERSTPHPVEISVVDIRRGTGMIYEREYEGHAIAFWPIVSVRTLWVASMNYLLIDGRLVAKSGGLCFGSVAKADIPHGGGVIPVEVKTKTSIRGPIHLDYMLLIEGKEVDSGTLRMSFMWKEPSDIEQAASAYAAAWPR
jgi:hypothetical protein